MFSYTKLLWLTFDLTTKGKTDSHNNPSAGITHFLTLGRVLFQNDLSKLKVRLHKIPQTNEKQNTNNDESIWSQKLEIGQHVRGDHHGWTDKTEWPSRNEIFFPKMDTHFCKLPHLFAVWCLVSHIKALHYDVWKHERWPLWMLAAESIFHCVCRCGKLDFDAV